VAKVKPTKKTKNPVAKKSLTKTSAKSGAQKAVVRKSLKKTSKPIAPKSFARKPVKEKRNAKVTPKPAPKAKPGLPKKNGIPEQLRDAALRVLDERQAEDIFVADVEGRSSVADYIIIASGRASRQITAIAGYLREAFDKLGAKQVRMEGLNEGNWVLVDCGDVIIHLFRPEVRKYYDLDRIWAERGPA